MSSLQQRALSALGSRAERTVARSLLALPPPLLRLLSGSGPIVVDGRTLDPQLQLLLALRRRRGRSDLLAADSPQRARAIAAAETARYASRRPAVSAVRDLEVAGGAGRLRARHYVPHTRTPRPLLVFVHGGGFVLGDLETHDECCRLLCYHGELNVLSVDYRLAPEHPFPEPLRDVQAALGWAIDHARDMGADPDRVGIGGDSAGGTLSAAACGLAVREGTPAPALQLLLYPGADCHELRPSRATLGTGGFGLSVRDLTFAEEHYLAGNDALRLDPRVSPLQATDLGGQCPAIVITAGFDPLRDEGNAYAEALQAAGNQVTHIELGGMVHAFAQMAGLSSAAAEAMQLVSRITRERFDAL